MVEGRVPVEDEEENVIPKKKELPPKCPQIAYLIAVILYLMMVKIKSLLPIHTGWFVVWLSQNIPYHLNFYRKPKMDRRGVWMFYWSIL